MTLVFKAGLSKLASQLEATFENMTSFFFFFVLLSLYFVFLKKETLIWRKISQHGFRCGFDTVLKGMSSVEPYHPGSSFFVAGLR